MINSIELPYYDLGYEIKVEDVNVGGRFPIYRILFYSNSLDTKMTTIKQGFKDYNRNIIIPIPNNIYGIIVQVNRASWSDYWLTLSLNNNSIYNNYFDSITTNLIKLNDKINNKIMIQYNTPKDDFGIVYMCYGLPKKKTMNTDIKINCFFVIERD